MASQFQVRCIKKQDRTNSHERILAIGGLVGSTRWSRTQTQAISCIKNDTERYWVQVAGKAVDVVVATSRYGNEYLKTEADGEAPNNLLSLPECP